MVSRKFVEIVKQDSDLLSVNLNVENITGANCIAACESVKAADPDGYTLLFVTANLSTIPWSTDRDDLNYADSFKAVISFSTEPLLLTIRVDDERFSDFESFVAYAQEHPGEVTIAGGGTTESVVVESMANEIGIDLDLVMYDGGSEMAAALAGGHIDAMFGSPSDVISYVEAGQLANIAVISDERYEEDFPDVPTPSEFGYDVVSADQWRGLVVPKDTPDDIVEELYEIFYNITQTDEFAEFLELNCMTPSYMNPEEFDAFLLEQDELYKEYFSSLEE
ncbi:MAG: tripartite tricarboxylate transporter substrate binding protein [Lachnospiraceae bacterium]|nr:tripartite tricarboxylate transporter substrate binding protein [Lachnospiraceae bacterium]